MFHVLEQIDQLVIRRRFLSQAELVERAEGAIEILTHRAFVSRGGAHGLSRVFGFGCRLSRLGLLVHRDWTAIMGNEAAVKSTPRKKVEAAATEADSPRGAFGNRLEFGRWSGNRARRNLSVSGLFRSPVSLVVTGRSGEYPVGVRT